MAKFYSPSTKGFYTDEPGFHGSRTIHVPDSTWTPPADDPDAIAPLVEITNPNTKIPADAVAVTDEEYAALFAAQSAGKHIVPGPDGNPITIDKPPPTPEVAMANLRGRRDWLLAQTDWSQLPDVPRGVSSRYATYRQALRDLPANTSDPLNPSWPAAPD